MSGAAAAAAAVSGVRCCAPAPASLQPPERFAKTEGNDYAIKEKRPTWSPLRASAPAGPGYLPNRPVNVRPVAQGLTGVQRAYIWGPGLYMAYIWGHGMVQGSWLEGLRPPQPPDVPSRASKSV